MQVAPREVGIESEEQGAVMDERPTSPALSVSRNLASVEREVGVAGDAKARDVQGGRNPPQNHQEAVADVGELGVGNKRDNEGVIQAAGAKHDSTASGEASDDGH